MKKTIIEKVKLLTGWGEDTFDSEVNLDRNKHATADGNMICFEAYNNSGFELEFQSERKEDFGTEYFKFRIKNDDFKFVPHGYYTVRGIEKNGKNYLPNGTPISILKNYGDSKFQGNKKASINTTVMK